MPSDIPRLDLLVRMSKVLAPRLEKLVSIEALRLSIAVSTPTRAIMPKAIMVEVRTVPNLFPLIELTPSRILSLRYIYEMPLNEIEIYH